MVLVKEDRMRSFHFARRTPSETTPMITSCGVSSGVMAKTLPIVMVWMLTDIGLTEA